MTAHEYLNQVYYLNRKIKYDLASLEELRELSCSIGSPSWGEKVDGSRNYDAPFVRALEKKEKTQNSLIDAVKAELRR